MLYTIVKIDLCGSKNFYDRKEFSDPDIRKKTLYKLKEIVQRIYPAADQQFPKGSLHALQGDCAYLILEKPTVALRATVEFMKAWYTIVSEMPDCRGILDHGEVETTDANGRLEIVSKVMEDINSIEKYVGAGEIGVTSSVIKRVDSTLVQFIKHREVEVTKTRSLHLAFANYENPRLLADSSLVHALFVASPVGDSVREKAFEALLIEALIERNPSELTTSDFNNWLESRSCPTINTFSMEVLLRHSEYVLSDSSGCLRLRDGVLTNINAIKTKFDSVRETTVKGIVERLSKVLGIPSDLVSEKLKISEMLEEYLCAVFLEVRFMANYFKSTESLFDRLIEVSDFDYILRKHLSGILKDKIEQFLLLKSEFLSSLRQVATRDNVYIASIFHNVLMLYYLNRNVKYIQTQISKIREKQIYLDTNTLYSLRCNASEYHDIIKYAIQRLTNIGTKVCVFNRSIDEYHESLNTALAKYNNKSGFDYYYQSGQSWIWKEYENNPEKYYNNFEYCVSLHKLNTGKQITPNGTIASLMDIHIDNLEPYLTSDDLGDIFRKVYNAKRIYNQDTRTVDIPANVTAYLAKVRHDANCLNFLKCEGNNPFDCPKLFVTCDFRLSKVRRQLPGKYEFLVTILEFYEFILPYLFLSDALSQHPVELPNFLLSSAITIDLGNTPDFDSIVGRFLSAKDDTPQDYETLSAIQNNDRFSGLKDKYKNLQMVDESELSAESFRNTILDIAAAIQEYKGSVAEKIAHSIAGDTLRQKSNKINQLEHEKQELETKLAKFEKKEKKKKLYEDRTRRRNKRLEALKGK